MAQIQDQKSCFYSQKQSVRDEYGAPQYLETAGDHFIKDLLKKQTNTVTTLKEQLELVHNFEKKSELNPVTQKGIISLKNFKKHISEENETSDTTSNSSDFFQDKMKMIGISRHELELTLCEKPNSTVSHLYKFAITNQKKTKEINILESKLPHHPMNRLNEIQEECFRNLKGSKKMISEKSSCEVTVTGRKPRKRNRKRKKKKSQKVAEIESGPKKLQVLSELLTHPIANTNEPGHSRPSLWDVKDIKKWSESKTYGYLPKKLYTIKNGKIVQLADKESCVENLT